MSTLTDVQDYYANLLILQYHSKPNAIATIKEMANLYYCDGLPFRLLNILDIDTAEGKQLDLIGKILGCSRNIQGLTIDKRYFSFEYVGAKGFSVVGQESEGIWKTHYNAEALVYALEDVDYRALLKFKAIKNIWYGSMEMIDDTLYNMFGTQVKMINNLDLSVTFEVDVGLSVALAAAIHMGYLKAPIGVQYDYIYV